MTPRIKYFEIIDILHTGHHGPVGEPKRGVKYDARRGKTFALDMDSLIPGNSLCFSPIILWTTPFEKFWFDGEVYHILTINSEYIVKGLF